MDLSLYWNAYNGLSYLIQRIIGNHRSRSMIDD
jgi:hypothetical protein